MSQVDFVSYFFLFIWFFSLIVCFYFIVFVYILPSIFTSLHTRFLFFSEIIESILILSRLLEFCAFGFSKQNFIKFLYLKLNTFYFNFLLKTVSLISLNNKKS